MPTNRHLPAGRPLRWHKGREATAFAGKRQSGVGICVPSDRLARDLQQPGVAAFLAHCGYTGTAPAACLDVLRRKLAVSSDFPHEIGLFLGYPLGDVIGFIENHGQNCLCSGVWKVYTNPEAAAGAFRKFSNCTRVYRRLFFGGQRNVEQLTVKSA